MDKQRSLGDIEFAGKKKKTKRETFLEKMDSMMPWIKWVAIIEECYPKGERATHRWVQKNAEDVPAAVMV